MHPNFHALKYVYTCISMTSKIKNPVYSGWGSFCNLEKYIMHENNIFKSILPVGLLYWYYGLYIFMYIAVGLYIIITIILGYSLYILLLSIIPSSFYANHTT